jgi:YVTN family beta-propeller protein
MIANYCHRSSFWKLFAAGLLLLTLVGPTASVGQSPRTSPVPETGQTALLGPIDVVASPNGKTLYVAGADAKQISVVDADGGKVSQSIAMPAEPTGLVLSPDGATLYVTCAASEGTVAVVDVKSGKVDRSISVGYWPIGPAISPNGKTLYVCNRFDNNVAVVGLATGRITLAPTTREPYAAAVTPNGKSVFVINHLPLDRADTYDVAAVVTVIDTATNKTKTIRMLNGSTCMRGICVSPDGRHVYATHLLSRYQMPTTQVERGWMNTNALSIIDARRKKLINTVLLDDVDLGAANPWGVACTADGKTICVTHAGTHEMSIIDGAALTDKLINMPATKEEARAASRDGDREVYSSLTAADVPNDLRFLHGLRRQVLLTTGKPRQKPTVNGLRGLVVVESRAFVAGYFTDNLAVVDLEPKPGDLEPSDLVSTITLGPAPELSVHRRGEMLFNDATLCHQHWQSCDSCHPDARVDALNWDLMNDGMGNPKNVRSMLLAHKSPPSMSLGGLSDAPAAVRSELAHLLFAIPTEEDAMAIDKYLESLEPVPSPYLVDGKLSTAAQRGKKLFFDAKVDCAKCHPEPLFTDMLMHDVGSRGQYDRRDTFDTPTLIECWRTAPYLHDGQYTTLKDLFAEGKHGLRGGDVGKLSEQQIRDLVEYVLSL